MQAAHGWLAAADKNPKWEKLVAGFTAPVPGSEIRPDKKAAKIYDKLLEKYAACESDALDGDLNRPGPQKQKPPATRIAGGLLLWRIFLTARSGAACRAAS